MTWKQKNTYTFIRNNGLFSTSTALYYLPLTGTVTEQTSPTTTQVQFLPTNSGKVSNMTFQTNDTPGDCLFTIRDDDGTLGTKTVSISGPNTINVIDFSSMDSGTNEFDGTKKIQIGFTPTASAESSSFTVTFDIDL